MFISVSEWLNPANYSTMPLDVFEALCNAFVCGEKYIRLSNDDVLRLL